MKEVVRWLYAAILLFPLVHCVNGAKPTGTPSAEVILQRAIAKAKSSASNSAPYQFTQVTITEERDSAGCVRDRKEDSNQVCASSASFLKRRDVKKPSKPNDSDPLKLKKYKCSDRSDAVNLLTPELINRYTIRLVQQTNINDRPTFELAFEPKDSGQPAREFVDRVLNQASGKLWIDTEEFELAKAEIKLNSEITVGGGLLGSLKKALVVLERIRLDGGIWFDRFYKTDYEARKLAASKHVVTWCEAKNFRKLQPQG